MINFIIYLKSTGEIIFFANVFAEELTQSDVEFKYPSFDPVLQDFMQVVGFVNTLEKYVVGGVLTDRPNLSDVATWDKTSIVPDGIDKATLGPGLPAGCVLTALSVPFGVTAVDEITINDGFVDITVPAEGLYMINVTAFPYKSTTTDIKGQE